jgi:hypothetical protein
MISSLPAFSGGIPRSAPSDRGSRRPRSAMGAPVSSWTARSQAARVWAAEPRRPGGPPARPDPGGEVTQVPASEPPRRGQHGAGRPPASVRLARCRAPAPERRQRRRGPSMSGRVVGGRRRSDELGPAGDRPRTRSTWDGSSVRLVQPSRSPRPVLQPACRLSPSTPAAHVEDAARGLPGGHSEHADEAAGGRGGPDRVTCSGPPDPVTAIRNASQPTIWWVGSVGPQAAPCRHEQQRLPAAPAPVDEEGRCPWVRDLVR